MELTKYTQFSGCGAKIAPGLLDKALCGLTQAVDPAVLVDFATSDDAGVYRIGPDTAIVQTLDFFPPIVDDPFQFGQIASVNALSDVYAMGGRPVTAMSIVGFPLDRLDIEVLREITRGCLDVLAQAGVSLVGGHSIQDAELKFGLSVTGLVHPDRVLKNNTLRRGDRLVLTKPLGTGTINMALRQGKASPQSLEAFIQSMLRLNKDAAQIIADYDVSACTDVTGFGLIGHASEMIVHTQVGLEIDLSSLEVLPGALEYLAMGLMPGGTAKNRDFRGPLVSNLTDLDPVSAGLIFDPQTSGGLLFGIAPEQEEACLAEMKSKGIDAFSLGVVTGDAQKITITGSLKG